MNLDACDIVRRAIGTQWHYFKSLKISGSLPTIGTASITSGCWPTLISMPCEIDIPIGVCWAVGCETVDDCGTDELAIGGISNLAFLDDILYWTRNSLVAGRYSPTKLGFMSEIAQNKKKWLASAMKLFHSISFYAPSISISCNRVLVLMSALPLNVAKWIWSSIIFAIDCKFGNRSRIVPNRPLKMKKVELKYYIIK